MKSRLQGNVKPDENKVLSSKKHVASTSWRCSKRRWLLTVMFGATLTLAIMGIIAQVRSIDEPYLNAKITSPFRYIHVSFLDDRPNRNHLRTFEMRNGTAFYINLDRDVIRRQKFTNGNKPVMDVMQRSSAHLWVTRNESAQNESQRVSEALDMQMEWEEKYPFLKKSSKLEQYGDAGCSLSHILLWKQQLLDRNNTDYIFVFEDDARIIEPLLSSRSIQAPLDADLVFLPKTATKTIDVFWEDTPSDVNNQNSLPEYSTRVIEGYGALGYIITREGAIKFFDFMHSSNEPIDIAFFDALSLRIYLPLAGQWPVVEHDAEYSSRRGFNSRKN